MIDLTRSPRATPEIHTLATDPGMNWTKDEQVAIEAPPDDDLAPQPEAHWSPAARRTGICGAVSPRVLMLPGGGYRMYYSQMLPRPGFPAGANDYDNCTTRILSAYSQNGETWTPEQGVRLSAEQGRAGDFRVVSSDVVPTFEGKFRMYYECCRGPQSAPSTILSAISDEGLDWRLEPGVRLEIDGRNLSSPRVIHFPDGVIRLFILDRGRGIVSASSPDGLNFRLEPGLRIAQGDQFDKLTAFAPEIIQVADVGYMMYYAGYSAANRAYILRAGSEDGLTWQKQPQPVLSPGGRWDAAKSSEMCIYRLPPGEEDKVRYRMVYEACDGTAVNERGVWRIASATSA